MSKVEVLGCLVMLGLAAMGCGSAPCPEGYVRMSDVCVRGGTDAARVRDAAWGADGWGVDGAVADGEAADAGLSDAGRTTEVDAAELMVDACVAGSETCNDLDDDCDGAVDEDLARPVFYPDGDGDGYGVGTGVSACAASATHSATLAGDCNDACASCHPGGTEICDEIDQDCVDGLDNGVLRVFYRDGDADGFGSPMVTATACSAPVDFVDNPDDCDDGLATVHPDADEACNAVDDDCSGIADDGLPVVTSYLDADGDGFAASSAAPQSGCAAPSGYTTRSPVGLGNADCADGDARAFPGQTMYFTGHVIGRSGNRDFDCDVDLEPQFPGGGFCTNDLLDCRGATGFAGIQPLCGATARTYQLTCGRQLVSGVFTCGGTTELRLQGCR